MRLEGSTLSISLTRSLEEVIEKEEEKKKGKKGASASPGLWKR